MGVEAPILAGNLKKPFLYHTLLFRFAKTCPTLALESKKSALTLTKKVIPFIFTRVLY